MPDLLYIEKNPILPESQDYARLKEQGIERIEALAHRLWTDYNVHDPGITILELLCYAITDLGYRTDYAVKDLLTREVNGEPVNTSAFHTARAIFPCNPVTFNDLRKLLIDIEGVRNAWIEKHRSVVYHLDPAHETLVDGPLPGTQPNPPLNGLYDAYIEYEDFVEDERIVHLGLLEQTATPGAYIQAGGRGLAFHVEYEFVLKAVHVYARNATDPTLPVEVTLRLIDADDTEQAATVVTIDTPEAKTRIPLGFKVYPGRNYRLVVTGGDAELYREERANFPFGIENVVHLVSGIRGQTPRQSYFFLYDWEINYAVPPPAQIPEYSEDLVIETVGLEDNQGLGGFVATPGRGIVFDVARALTLEAVSVYGDAPGPVTIRLLDSADQVLATAEGTIIDAATKTRLPLWFEVEPGQEYRLDAEGTPIQLFRATQAAYPFSLDGVITLTQGHPTPTSYFFFFDWEISYVEIQGVQVQAASVTKEDIRLEVLHRLHHYRNLCEDFVNVCELAAEEIAVCADLEVIPSARIDAVLAEIFFQLARHVSPPVNFYTIDELLDRGKTTDEIFEGPLLDHGFIDDDEFRAIERTCRLRTSDLIQIIMDVETDDGVKAVTAVKEISLLSFIDGVLRLQADWILDLATDRFRVPVFDEEKSKFIFYKNGLPYYPNRGRVAELLAEKKARELQTKLKGHEQDLPVPVGAYKNLSDYYPVQNELPAVYRVGPIRVPASFPERRKAQARQLKAYLMFFEQLFANYLAQLAHVDELFSWEPVHARTYFTQPVGEIADLADVYVNFPTLATDLEAIIEDEDTAQERKLRFLEHLIGRFAESFTEYSLLMFSLPGTDAAPRVIADQQAFLADYPKLSNERGKGYDVRYPALADTLTGYQRRVYRLLGIHDVTRRHFAGHLFDIEEVAPGQWRFVLTDEGGTLLFESFTCETRASIEVLLDFALTIGGDAANYEVNAGDTAFELIRRCRGEGDDEPIGQTTSKEVLNDVVAYFARYANAEGFHAIEHLLLRKRTQDDPFLPVQLNAPGDCSCVEVREPYSFRLSVILPAWPARFQDMRFRQFVNETLRLEAPAHVFVKICWISHTQMKTFETCYTGWLDRLAALDDQLGPCRTGGPAPADDRSGQLPLPPTEGSGDPQAPTPDEAYRDALAGLIDKLHSLDNVYPLARLHDCEETDSDAPQISLNNTSLGTF